MRRKPPQKPNDRLVTLSIRLPATIRDAVRYRLRNWRPWLPLPRVIEWFEQQPDSALRLLVNATSELADDGIVREILQGARFRFRNRMYSLADAGPAPVVFTPTDNRFLEDFARELDAQFGEAPSSMETAPRERSDLPPNKGEQPPSKSKAALHDGPERPAFATVEDAAQARAFITADLEFRSPAFVCALWNELKRDSQVSPG